MMHKKLLSIIVLIILVASTLAGCGEGSSIPSTVATLSEIEGDVSVMESGTESWTDGQIGMSLVVGDSVKTGNDSSAEITFLDGNTIELEANTEIEITSVDVSTDTGGTTVTITQTIGTVISRLTQLLDPASSYETVTTSGVTSVRAYPAHPATTVVGVAGNGTTWIANQGGDVWMKGQDDIELLVTNGQRGLVMPGHSPELMPPNMPPLAHDDAFPANELNPVVISRPGVLFNDFDPDVYDLLHVTAVNTSGTVGSLISWGPRGAFTYDPNGQFEYLQAGNSTTDSYTYTVTDACGSNDTATVTITIHGVD
jgi:VCBS repeat-containing protein